MTSIVERGPFSSRLRALLTRYRRPITDQLAWSLLSAALAALSSIVLAVLAARRLAPEGFGRLSLLLTVQMVLTTLMASALGQTAARLTAELRVDDVPRLRRVVAMLVSINVALSVGLAALCLLGGPAVRAATLGPGAPLAAMEGAALVLLCAGLTALQQGLLTGFGAFRELALTNGARFLLCATALWLAPATLEGVVWGLGAGALAGLAVGEWSWRRVHGGTLARLPWRDGRKEVSLLWSYAVPSWITGALFVTSAWLGAFLTSRQANGLIEVGLFNAASQWGRSMPLFVPNSFAGPLLIALTGFWARRDTPAMTRLMRRGVWLSLGTTLAPAVLVYVMGATVLAVYGPAYVEGLAVLRLLLVTTSIVSFTVIINATLMAAGRTWTVAAITATWACVFVGMLLFAPARGAWGLGMAYLVAYLVQVVVTMVPLRQILRPAAG